MKKEKARMIKKYSTYFILILVVIVISIFLIFKRNMISNIIVEDGVVKYNQHIKRVSNNLLYNGIDKEAQNTVVAEVDNIKFFYKGEELILKSRIKEKNSRYYLPINEFYESMKIDINKIKSNIDFKKGQINKEGKEYELRGGILSIDGLEYASLNDLVFILNLTDKWDQELGIIYLDEKEEVSNANIINEERNGKAALLRLEDITAGGGLIKDDNILKMKILGDYLNSNGIKFNVAWIPRFLNPEYNIDNDLLVEKNMGNIQFVSLLDSWIFSGGKVGLHGYTHQFGEEESVIGTELSRKNNNDEESTRAVIEKSIQCANILNIPIYFFESPHYSSSRKQEKICEEYFSILYEPFQWGWNMNPLISFKNKETLYVPASLLNIDTDTKESIVKKIERNKTNKSIITSMFYHPSGEYENIEILPLDEKGNIRYVFNEDSFIKTVVDGLNNTNHSTITVDEL